MPAIIIFIVAIGIAIIAIAQTSEDTTKLYKELMLLRLLAAKTSILAIWYSFSTTMQHLVMALIWALAFIGSWLCRGVRHLSILLILLSIKDRFL